MYPLSFFLFSMHVSQRDGTSNFLLILKALSSSIFFTTNWNGYHCFFREMLLERIKIAHPYFNCTISYHYLSYFFPLGLRLLAWMQVIHATFQELMLKSPLELRGIIGAWVAKITRVFFPSQPAKSHNPVGAGKCKLDCTLRDRRFATFVYLDVFINYMITGTSVRTKCNRCYETQ